MKNKINKIILYFENVAICELKPEMFKNLIIEDIKKNINVNCYYNEKQGEIHNKVSCDYFSVIINKEGLKQFVKMDNCSLEEKLRYKDIVSVELEIIDYKKNKIKKQEIYVPWNEEDEYVNMFQEVTKNEDGNFKIEIQKNKPKKEIEEVDLRTICFFEDITEESIIKDIHNLKDKLNEVIREVNKDGK